MIDLANALIKETYKPKTNLRGITERSPESIRQAVIEARRFILDEPMSQLLAALASVPYDRVDSKEKKIEVLTSERRSSRLPYPKIFVQFDGKAFRRGLQAIAGDKKDLWGKELADPEDVIDPVGWLIEQIDNLVVLTEFFEIDNAVATVPFSWMWTTRDATANAFEVCNEKDLANNSGALYSDFDCKAAQLATGMVGHIDPSIAIAYTNRGGKAAIPARDRVTVKQEGQSDFYTHALVGEMGGVVRYAFAFLSTLNEVPVRYERARPTAHYLSNGKRRTAVDVHHVRLILPNRTINYRQMARGIYHDIAHKKNHPVRGHWRMFCDSPSKMCISEQEHVWGQADATGHADCIYCTASRTWIKDHRRGDEALGRVDHDYSVGAR
jgi:hypothetical protein